MLQKAWFSGVDSPLTAYKAVIFCHLQLPSFATAYELKSDSPAYVLHLWYVGYEQGDAGQCDVETLWQQLAVKPHVYFLDGDKEFEALQSSNLDLAFKDLLQDVDRKSGFLPPGQLRKSSSLLAKYLLSAINHGECERLLKELMDECGNEAALLEAEKERLVKVLKLASDLHALPQGACAILGYTIGEDYAAVIRMATKLAGGWQPKEPRKFSQLEQAEQLCATQELVGLASLVKPGESVVDDSVLAGGSDALRGHIDSLNSQLEDVEKLLSRIQMVGEAAEKARGALARAKT